MKYLIDHPSTRDGRFFEAITPLFNAFRSVDSGSDRSSQNFVRSVIVKTSPVEVVISYVRWLASQAFFIVSGERVRSFFCQERRHFLCRSSDHFFPKFGLFLPLFSSERSAFVSEDIDHPSSPPCRAFIKTPPSGLIPKCFVRTRSTANAVTSSPSYTVITGSNVYPLVLIPDNQLSTSVPEYVSRLPSRNVTMSSGRFGRPFPMYAG